MLKQQEKTLWNSKSEDTHLEKYRKPMTCVTPFSSPKNLEARRNRLRGILPHEKQQANPRKPSYCGCLYSLRQRPSRSPQCCSQLMELPRVPSNPILGIKAIARVAPRCLLGPQELLCSNVPERNAIPSSHIWDRSCHCSAPQPWVPGLGSELSLTGPHCHCCEPQFFPKQGL